MSLRKVALYFLVAILVSWFVSTTGHALDKEQRIKDQVTTPTSISLGSPITAIGYGENPCTDQIPACKTCELTFSDCHVEIDSNGEGNVYGGNRNIPAVSCQEDDPCYKLPTTE